MANILIGYKNLLFEDDTTVTAGDEHADHPDDNLQLKHPESYWRADDLTASYVQIDLGQAKTPDLAAILYSTATRQRNLLRETDTIDASALWSKTNATVTIGLSPPAGVSDTDYTLAATGGAVSHYLSQTRAVAAYATRWDSSIKYIAAQCYVKEKGATFPGTLEMEIDYASASGLASIEIDPTAGTVNTTNTTSMTIVSSGIESVGDGWYRVWLVASDNFAGGSFTQDIVLRCYLTDETFARTYTPATPNAEAIGLAGLKLSLSNDISVYEPNPTNDAGGIVVFKRDSSAMTPPSAGTAFDAGDQTIHSVVASEVADSRDWGHAWHSYLENRKAYQHYLIEIHDQDNANGQVDTSNLYLGPAWQPTQNVKTWGIRPGKTREWDLSFEFATWADAMGEAHAMGLQDRITDGLSVGRSYSGAEYVAELNPILVIVDPDEGDYGQQMILYGRLTSFQMGLGVDQHVAGDRGDGEAGQRPGFSFSIRELIPG